MRHVAVFLIVLISGSVTAVAQDDWNTPHEPFRIFGNTYYVGTAGLSAILTSNAGHILIDGGLPQSAPLSRRTSASSGSSHTGASSRISDAGSSVPQQHDTRVEPYALEKDQRRHHAVREQPSAPA